MTRGEVHQEVATMAQQVDTTHQLAVIMHHNGGDTIAHKEVITILSHTVPHPNHTVVNLGTMMAKQWVGINTVSTEHDTCVKQRLIYEQEQMLRWNPLLQTAHHSLLKVPNRF